MRCLHCNTTETPLWRAGPHGPKTLCNACGVRWKKTGSVIPRSQTTTTKRPSTPPPALRKRARTTPPSNPPSPDRLVAPKPVSVFRVADAARPKYESVFSGLMVVQRTNKEDGVRTRTHTTKGDAFFQHVQNAQNAQQPALPPLNLPQSPLPPLQTKSPSPKAQGESDVYVTEVHAPSPSPSPPPMPKVQKTAEGGGFSLVMSVRKPPS